MGKRKVLFRAAALALAAVMTFSWGPSKFVKADSVDSDQYLALGRSQFKRKTDSTGTARGEQHKRLYVDYSYK